MELISVNEYDWKVSKWYILKHMHILSIFL